VGKPEGERMLERRILEWKDGIRMDLKEIKWEDVDWIDLLETAANGRLF
jgi:hypothetical protein